MNSASNSHNSGIANTDLHVREEVARIVNERLSRLPLILLVLEGLRQPPLPAAGDPELRAGCVRAITAILASLARVKPAASQGKAAPEEQAAHAWTKDRKVHELLDPDQLDRLESFICRLLPIS